MLKLKCSGPNFSPLPEIKTHIYCIILVHSLSVMRLPPIPKSDGIKFTAKSVLIYSLFGWQWAAGEWTGTQYTCYIHLWHWLLLCVTFPYTEGVVYCQKSDNACVVSFPKTNCGIKNCSMIESLAITFFCFSIYLKYFSILIFILMFLCQISTKFPNTGQFLTTGHQLKSTLLLHFYQQRTSRCWWKEVSQKTKMSILS